PDGKLTIITREGTFAGGVEKLVALFEELRSSGIDIENVRFEQHRHDEAVCACQGVHHHV
ncbi:hypothetical protein, partial [Desulfofundulus sp.]|uniref:hypothetical protein n=1 Tax=Desulfofundulus sp. TaxID=2282750 RepID=UPI003C751235